MTATSTVKTNRISTAVYSPKHLAQRVLHHLIFRGADSNRPRLAVVLRDVHTPDGLMPILLRHQPFVQVPQISPQVLFVLLLCNAVHAHRRILTNATKGVGEHLLIDEMSQRVKLPRGLLFRSFRYPLESGCHATRRRCTGHVSPQRLTSARASFARPGPGAARSPMSSLFFRPSDSPRSLAPSLRFPLLGPTLTARTSSLPSPRGLANALSSGLVTGSLGTGCCS